MLAVLVHNTEGYESSDLQAWFALFEHSSDSGNQVHKIESEGQKRARRGLV